MIRPLAAYRVLGPPAPRRSAPWSSPSSPHEHQTWLIDSAHTSVAALWLDDTLWLCGEHVHTIASGVCERLTPSSASPPGLQIPEARSWVSLAPEPGTRYVACAGNTQGPDPNLADHTSLLDQLLVPLPAPKAGLLAKLFGNRAPSPEAVALIIDATDDPPPADLPTWLADLRTRTIDLSWTGNESGPGLVHTIRKPLHEHPNVRAALLAHAREDPEITALIRESAEAWLEAIDEDPPAQGRLVDADATRGFIEELELSAITENVEGSTGAWLDPGTAHARSAWSLELPGASILATLRRTVDQATIVAVHSAPTDAVLAIHLVGGIDRQSGDLVGFALQRVWT